MPSDMGSGMAQPSGFGDASAVVCDSASASVSSADGSSGDSSSTTSSSLPVTGTQLVGMVAIGLALLVVGAGLLVVTRRRGVRLAASGGKTVE